MLQGRILRNNIENPQGSTSLQHLSSLPLFTLIPINKKKTYLISLSLPCLLLLIVCHLWKQAIFWLCLVLPFFFFVVFCSFNLRWRGSYPLNYIFFSDWLSLTADLSKPRQFEILKLNSKLKNTAGENEINKIFIHLSIFKWRSNIYVCSFRCLISHTSVSNNGWRHSSPQLGVSRLCSACLYR